MNKNELANFRAGMKEIFDTMFGGYKFYKIGNKSEDHVVVYYWKVGGWIIALKSWYTVIGGGSPVLSKISVVLEEGGVVTSYDYC